MQRHVLTTRVESIRAPLKSLNAKLDRGVDAKMPKTSEKTPESTATKKKFNSPPHILIDKKGKTTFTRSILLGEVSCLIMTKGWIRSLLSSK
jgi:hypothetical protein